ncbi:malto-oligosyltrehalose synthase [Azospirillum halopraeferens]|uniref:malto-oligosyltrehalose synthase n=1 Tax=Azospirillum halopraeferens TaxID=34010 RepID=UPI00041B8587|nr:malto-oligosyltrehalose synthase [Azospirillum halopraeferens]
MTDAPYVPRATLRLQFHAGFTFEQARELAPYMAQLGVSHVYASPFLKARGGSTHGYDITDHSQFNPEVGDGASFDRFVEALHNHGIGLILDFVPNHMGVGGNDNPWWLDVLEWGPASPFAPFFDIDWEPLQPGLHGKVLLPFLGDHYGNVLERGELQLRFDAGRGSFSVWYYSHRFPVAVRHYARLLRRARDTLGEDGVALDALIAAFAGLGGTPVSVQRQHTVHREAEELRAQLAAIAAADGTIADAIERMVTAVNGTPGDPDSLRDLHRLLEEQHYRPAYWRVAADEINYRRFFDINDLAGLRIDRPELFELAHQLVFRLIGEGKLQGIRLDHVDGLFDPVGYFEKLQDRAAYLTIQAGPATADPPGLRLREPFYVVVEKILAHHENLRDDWPVAGTTGYEFMTLVGGLFVDASAERAMTDAYHTFIRRDVDFDRLVLETKRKIMVTSLSSELNVLATALYRLAQQSWTSRDFTLTGIRRALIDVVACLPVYRTYVTAERVYDADRRDLDWAVGRARKLAGAVDESLYDFLHGVLGTDLAARHVPGGDARGPRGADPADIVQIAMKFQQFSGPVMAKSLEDTVFYRYFRLVALNEVGGEPGRFGTSVSAFHHLNQDRLKRWPFNMLATATHDHKRGEDTRLRIAALSELADLWEGRVRRWNRMNRFKKREINGAAAPGRNDEYLLYQTLVGTWPLELEWPSGPGLDAYADRIVAYMVKAVREAKVRSSWASPDADYEDALERFVRGILDPVRGATFMAELLDLLETVAPAAAVHGLAQTLLKLTAPGVPDIYQGTDFWDLSLVDPDNRRPVDYAARRAALDALPEDGGALLDGWHDGRVKQFVIARTLDLRRREPVLFAAGEYRPVEVQGEHAERIVAFLRRLDTGYALVVAPRLVVPLLDGASRPLPPAQAWGDTALLLPELPEGAPCDVFTGRRHDLPVDCPLPVKSLLDRFPVALLHCRPSDQPGEET